MIICMGLRGPDGMCAECGAAMTWHGAHCALCGDVYSPCACSVVADHG